MKRADSEKVFLGPDFHSSRRGPGQEQCRLPQPGLAGWRANSRQRTTETRDAPTGNPTAELHSVARPHRTSMGPISDLSYGHTVTEKELR